jgi:hypothetical protein
MELSLDPGWGKHLAVDGIFDEELIAPPHH